MRIYYRSDRDKFRVWLDEWQGDQFEIYTKEELAALEEMLKRLSIFLVEANEDE